MIRPLRSRHRRVWLILAVVVPLLVALALAVRPGPPSREDVPEAISAASAAPVAASVEESER